MKKINITITGALGRMGQILINQISKSKNLKLYSLTDSDGLHEVVDQDWTTLLKVKEKFCVQNGCFLQFDEASYDIHTA